MEEAKGQKKAKKKNMDSDKSNNIDINMIFNRYKLIIGFLWPTRNGGHMRLDHFLQMRIE